MITELNGIQRLQLADRTVSDAEFIKRGASYDSFGRLVLGETQLELVTVIGPDIWNLPIDRTPPPEPTAADAWLDTPLEDAWTQAGQTGNLYNYLRRSGIHSRRDMLTAGKNALAGETNIGPKRIQLFQEMIDGNDFGFSWEGALSPEEIAAFCPRLSQVHFGALGLGFSYNRFTVLELVDSPLERRRAFVASYLKPSLKPELVSNAPELFAARFELERQRLELLNLPDPRIHLEP